MSVKVIFMGRPTKDPVMSQSQNGTEYISLDVAVSQRSQTGNDETVFYQCYFSKGLADRLVKAKVKKGSCLSIVGSLELHPFMYQQGNNAGKPGINANVRVLDWEYTISNRPENAGNTPNQSNHPNGYGQTGNGPAYPAGNVGGTPALGGTGYQTQGAPASRAPQGNPQNHAAPPQSYPNQNYPQEQSSAGGYPQESYGGFQNVPQEQLPFPN